MGLFMSRVSPPHLTIANVVRLRAYVNPLCVRPDHIVTVVVDLLSTPRVYHISVPRLIDPVRGTIALPPIYPNNARAVLGRYPDSLARAIPNNHRQP